MGGTAGGSIGEPFNRPLTAHFLGGCAIGDSVETGVIDPYQRVYELPRPARRRRLRDHREPRGQPVADDHRAGRAGDVVLAQPGRARPRARRWARRTAPVAPVRPASPAVPADAPGALRLPIVGVS